LACCSHEQIGEREDLALNNRGDKNNNKKEPKTTVKKGEKKTKQEKREKQHRSIT
jgi:hypothetical protein